MEKKESRETCLGLWSKNAEFEREGLNKSVRKIVPSLSERKRVDREGFRSFFAARKTYSVKQERGKTEERADDVASPSYRGAQMGTKESSRLTSDFPLTVRHWINGENEGEAR